MLKRARDIASPHALDDSIRDTDFALVIGVDHYPRFRPLRGAVADATKFHAWLCDREGGGLKPANARLVVSRARPVSPLQDEVDEQLLALMSAADARGGGRRLYFHFSGHGASAPDESREDVALLLAKWSRNLARLALSTDEYCGALNGIGLFTEVVISLDCCRATAERAVGLPPTITLQPHAQRCATRCFIAYATEIGRSAYEAPDDCLWQGVFTRCLLAILRHSPSGITAADLKRALECEVLAYGQQAYVLNGLREDSRFGRGGTLPKLVVEFHRARGQVRLRDGRRTIVAERVVSDEPWELELAAGLYKLEDSAGAASAFDHGAEEVTRVRF